MSLLMQASENRQILGVAVKWKAGIALEMFLNIFRLKMGTLSYERFVAESKYLGR